MHAPHPAASYHSNPPASRAPTMPDPGAFVLIGTEYDIVVARALTITATSACLIAATTRELVMLPLSIGAGASLDFSLDGYHVVAALKDGCVTCGLQALDFRRR